MVSTIKPLPAMAADPQGHPVLANHRARSITPIQGWGSALFGIPFMAAGLLMGLLALDRFPAHKHASCWLIALVAGMFFCGGALFAVHGLRDVIRQAAYRRQAAQRPSEPWLYDFPWRRDGIAFGAFDDMLGRLLAAMVWTTFLLPFAWVGMKVRGAWPFLAAVALVGLLGLIFWFRWAQTLFEVLLYGHSFLTYESLPFALGGTLRARLRSPHRLCAIDQLTLTLRCVQERGVNTGQGPDRSTRVVCYELYKDVATYDRDRLIGLASNDVSIEFRLPPDQPATDLAAGLPTYWEIEAKGKARGVDYEAVFLVPVYKVSGA
ncbi:MAG TPA: hypothetical protein VEJ45_00580 [Candidatus Acidoferrales bacterium]|nr:hypothetical protein [Candidatus Acidoferrales bacterium]